MNPGEIFLANAWRRAAGLPPRVVATIPPPAVLRETEWSPAFERAMRARLVMGALRYGRLGDPGKPAYDRVTGIRARLDKYEKTGNLEYLVDAANLALCEFVEGRHPRRHFRSTDDEIHVSKGG